MDIVQPLRLRLGKYFIVKVVLSRQFLGRVNWEGGLYIFFTLTLLCLYFHLPCCALIFLRTYPAAPLFLFALTLLCLPCYAYPAALTLLRLPCCAIILFSR